jgi:hypothetical protein
VGDWVVQAGSARHVRLPVRLVRDLGQPADRRHRLPAPRPGLRVAATRLSFFLSIPALVGAGLFELKDAATENVSVSALAVGTAVSFVVAYGSIAWLLRFVAHHPISLFVPYRVVLGVALLGLLAAGTITAT